MLLLWSLDVCNAMGIASIYIVLCENIIPALLFYLLLLLLLRLLFLPTLSAGLRDDDDDAFFKANGVTLNCRTELYTILPLLYFSVSPGVLFTKRQRLFIS